MITASSVLTGMFNKLRAGFFRAGYNRQYVMKIACKVKRILTGAALMTCAIPVFAQIQVHHELHVQLHPQQHRLVVEDQVSLAAGTPRTVYFSLHRDLQPHSSDAKLEFAGVTSKAWLSAYRITLPDGQNRFTLAYAGEIFHPPQQDVREARSFESTPGIISMEGVVLDGNSGWYPHLADETGQDGDLTFALDVALPEGWHAVSQGKAGKASKDKESWQEQQPQNEIYLIAAPFKVYQQALGEIDALVYLREDDAPLAQRYLSATQHYLSLYQQLIGPYPYAKFALVENFWQTGYGMPSFTLLGSQVIRLPFIIDSSYPHEILHNWWGNGVYVDYASGNWSEGLTAYLADHLIQEQKGKGAEYRRGALQKYADFVSAERDFPLTQFTSRHSAQSEAVGYGKAMLLFHMLRRQLGDAMFAEALRNFYRDYLFKKAGFADIQQSFSKTSGQDLGAFFAQWVQRSGAPQLHLISVQAHQVGNDYELSVLVEQTQAGAAYELDVPLAITLAGREVAEEAVLKMKGKHATLHLSVDAEPLRVDIDPEFDLFRRLDQAEIPPALSQVFGAEQLTIVLPRNAPEVLRTQYQQLAQAWQQQPARVAEVKWDDEIEQLPTQGAVWLFGSENRWFEQFQQTLQRSGVLNSEAGEWLNKNYVVAQQALALTTRIGQTPVAWLAVPDAAMLPTLARKLPHYAKYSYAAFAGPTLANLNKGIWAVTDSPLAQAVRLPQDVFKPMPARARLAARDSLVQP